MDRFSIEFFMPGLGMCMRGKLKKQIYILFFVIAPLLRFVAYSFIYCCFNIDISCISILLNEAYGMFSNTQYKPLNFDNVIYISSSLLLT